MYGRKVRAHRGCKRRLQRSFSRGLEPKSGRRGVVWMGIKPKSGRRGVSFLLYIQPVSRLISHPSSHALTIYHPIHTSTSRIYTLYHSPSIRFIQNSQLPTKAHLRSHSKAQTCLSIIRRALIKTIYHLYFSLVITIKSYFELHDYAFDPVQKHFRVTG